MTARRVAYLKATRGWTVQTGTKPLQRATARFATVYAAGSLAIHYGIFTWKRSDLLRAVLACQFDSLRPRHSLTPDARLGRQLAEYIAQHRGDFLDLDKTPIKTSNHQLGSVPGYEHTWKGVPWVYLSSEQLTGIIGAGQEANRLKERLVQDGIMAATGQRKLVQRPVFQDKGNKGYRWVHALRTDALLNWMEDPWRRTLNRNR